MHTPEYAFEKVAGNVEKGAADLGITYPVAQDNSYSTWTNYRNRYWPAEYLIDTNGVVRHIKFGEGDYNGTEKRSANCSPPPGPGSRCRRRWTPRHHPEPGSDPRDVFRGGQAGPTTPAPVYTTRASATFAYPPALPDDTFALQGPWTLDYQGATADSDPSNIKLSYHAKNVYIVVGGTGNLAVTRDGERPRYRSAGRRRHTRSSRQRRDPGITRCGCQPGLQVFSFTYG